MGKASRWFRSVLGFKKPSDHSLPHQHAAATTTARPKEKRRWSFVKSYREKENHGASAESARALQGARDGSSSAARRTQEEEVVDDGDGVVERVEEDQEEDPTERAIAVAAATAAVAEAAVAAAHAAAEVVRLTSSGRSVAGGMESSVVGGVGCSSAYVSGSLGLREDFAALKIQAAFRGYLARRALKALRSLVRLQALVRGHIERKRTAAWLQQMQAVLLAQARARVGRLQASESSQSQSSGGKSSHSHHHYHYHPDPATPEKFEHGNRSKSGKYEPSSLLRRNGSRSNDSSKPHSSLKRSETRPDHRSWDLRASSAAAMEEEDEKNISSDRILEIDNGGGRHQFHHYNHGQSKRRNMFHSANLSFFYDQYSQSFTTSKDTCPSPAASGEVQSTLMYHHHPLDIVDQEVFCTAENSPQVFSAASSRGGAGKRSPFTPTRSDGSRSSFLSAFADHPNYMSYTESARAKARSLSAPKQRPPQYERSGSGKRFGEARSSSAQRASAVKASFASKGYPGSGRLDQLGMPLWQRC